LRCVCSGGGRAVTVFAEAEVLEGIRGHQVSNIAIIVSHMLMIQKEWQSDRKGRDSADAAELE